ncbi:hypothetical protein JR316_0004359 [Psilocybe cubensis]|uniref:Uncharacterized protein n=2 Tax=Psilocybe cubensis TaxID=181762 RepID=A0ACB8H438_PSICU|nr:hypothetical protein JR316_0004359 [Psilocybe cubensis]KAH9482261.1 hypothetical protein JR316_0004359 [Psilocybe cubensis]
MSKRVHFATTNITYQPGYESSPSPTSSSSSLPSDSSSSSSELLTPPPIDEDDRQSAYPRTPFAKELDLYPEVVTPGPTTQMQIHFLLAFTPYSKPAFYHNLAFPLSSVENKYPPRAFSEPATSPPLPSLTIFHPRIKQEIIVNPNPPVAGSFVSVRDVLVKLYMELRLAIHPSEYAAVPKEERRFVDDAYWRRCRKIRNEADRIQEEQKGIKRIDLLMGQTRFTGLSGTLRAPDIWELNVGLP